jgi:hypothetical protein
MRDPHVEAVYYEVGTGEGISFGDPPDIRISNHLGAFEVSNGKLSVYPVQHFPSGAEARAVIDPFLRAWELDSDLTRNIGSIRFKFLSVRKVDRDPPAPGTGELSAAFEGTGVLAIGGNVSVHITQNTYPAPPTDFRTTPEVELAYGRWRAFREGREPLQSMAYAVLTLMESMAGGRKQAASTLQVDARTLETIGRLSSTKGDAATIRKFGKGLQLQDLSGGESSWLEAAVRRLVRRMGEHAAGVQLSRITMNDLPPL